MSEHDREYMRHALRLAARGRGYVEPNPMVGAVVVRDGQVVGEGWHEQFGGPHAEVAALQAAGDAARGATLYVTLEPCCHQGKTPPCTQAVREAGVAHVHAAMVDPNPEVAGGGLRELEAAGVTTRVGPLTRRAMLLNEPFIKRMTTGLPFVIAKWAATLDGAIATAAGHSQWISNSRSRKLVHRVRGRVDAIVVGIGTALADDPMLTARDAPARRTARRVVIDPRMRLPTDAALVTSAGTVPVTLAVSQPAIEGNRAHADALAAAGVELLPLPTTEREGGRTQLDLGVLMRHLAEQHDATNVLLEGGAGTTGAFLQQRLIDEIWAFIAPRLLGDGRHHLPPLTKGGPAAERMDEAHELDLRHVRRLGQDVLLRYRVRS